MKTYYITLFLTLTLVLTGGSQNINREVTGADTPPYLWGEINRDGLTTGAYKEWFQENYNHYNTDIKSLHFLEEALQEYTIHIFMGTWCGDSKKEVPAFLKILDSLHFPASQLQITALSRDPDKYKQGPEHEEKGLNIHRVPTFIFYKNGIEQNRIVESPVETLELDLSNIINGNHYKSNYQIVAMVDSILTMGGTRKFKKEKKEILKKFENRVQSIHELNTYAHILFYTGREQEAIAVSKLNTELFPNLYYPYHNLADKYERTGKKRKALKMYKKALALKPDDQDLQEKVNSLQGKPEK